MLQRILRQLTAAERKKGIWVVCAVFLRALLDLAGLASLLPILFYLLDGEGCKRTALLFCVAALAFILAKNTLALRLARYQSRFLLSLYRRLSSSLLASYYTRGLLFIRRKGSLRLGYEASYLGYAFSFNLLSPWLALAGDGLLILLVTAFLLAWSPAVTGVLYAAFVPFALVYSRSIRKRMRRYGEEEQQARREQARLATEALKGYAELEVNRAFPLLQRSFANRLETVSACRLKLETVQHLPLCLSETAVVTGLAFLTASGADGIRAMTGVFAIAAFRLLPALRNLLGGWTQVQNAGWCLPLLEAGLNETAGAYGVPDTCKLPFEKEISIREVSFVYPDGRKVLENFGCTIRKGEYIGITGESGTGKSTLFNLLLGFFPPSAGEIRIDDVPLTASVKAAWRRRVGYVPQEVFILDDTLAGNIALGCERPDRDKVRRILEQVKLETWARGLPQGMDTPLGEGGTRLSGGQKQRVGIARALYKEADVLLLDEATSALDDETERAVNETLRRLADTYRGLTVVTIAHRESTLSYCHRIIHLTPIDSWRKNTP